MLLIRSLLFQIYFWLWTAFMTLSHVPILLFDSQEIVLASQRRWASGIMWGLRVLTGTRIELRGREHVPEKGALVACKHLSMWETVMLHIALPRPAFILKRVLVFVPLYGWYALRARMIAVDRSGHASSLRRMVADARARLADGRQIVIFPEGTRRPIGAPPDYKPGVAALYTQLGAPCVPVALNSGVFWPRKGLVRRPGTIVIEFLPPIPAGLRRKEFMATLEGTIESATALLVAQAREAGT